MLTASLQTIGNAAKKIISLIENSGEQIEEGEGEQSPAPLAIPAWTRSVPASKRGDPSHQGKGSPKPPFTGAVPSPAPLPR